MLNKILCSTILLLSLASTVLGTNITSVKASVNKNVMPIGEPFTYSVTINGTIKTTPDRYTICIPDEFNVIRKSTSKSISVINGTSSMCITYEYALVSKKTGTFKIPQAKVTFKNETYLTNSIEIRIMPNKNIQNVSTGGNNQKNADTQASNQTTNKAFVKASVNKKTVYENEKLIYRANVYTSTDLALASRPKVYTPNFSGFWDDGFKSKNHVEVVGNSNYNVVVYEIILYPVGVGVKNILPTEIAIEPIDDFFHVFSMGRGETKILKTNKIDVTVIPLPQEDKPSDFLGAVGDFEIKAFVDKKAAETNEPITLTVIVSGNGNMKSVRDINFTDCRDFRKYDSMVANTSGDSKEFKVIFIPLTPGEKEIPSASLSFFNPNKKQYKTIKTQAQKVTISGEFVHQNENIQTRSKTDTQITPTTIMHPHKQIKTLKLYNGYLIKNPIFYLSIAPFILLLILSGCYRFYVSKTKNNPFKKLKKSDFGKFYRLLDESQISISKDNFRNALDSIYQALIEAINVKTSIASDNLTKDQITDNLRKNSTNDETISRIIKMLEKLNFYRFGPVDIDKDLVMTLLEEVKNIRLNLKR
ncbi:MAG: BatD family protein [Endomicrobium sp.]|jgi:hypothetical protein|nr:BatD family protein [Endomicrobium sp.]